MCRVHLRSRSHTRLGQVRELDAIRAGGKRTDRVRHFGAEVADELVRLIPVELDAERGIDLGLDGVTPNDSEDIDTGSNELQNYPVLTSVTAGAAGTADIVGTLNSTPGTTFVIEFFANVAADNEGELSVGTTPVTTDGGGNASVTANIVVPSGGYSNFTATATNPASSPPLATYNTVLPCPSN